MSGVCRLHRRSAFSVYTMTDTLSLLWVTSGMEVSPETAEKGMLEKQHEFFSSFGNPPDRENIY